MPYIHGPRRTFHRMRPKQKDYTLPKMEQPIVTPVATSVPNLSAETVPQSKQDVGREHGNLVLAKEVTESANGDVNGPSSKNSEETDSLQNFMPVQGRKKPKKPHIFKSHHSCDMSSLESTLFRRETEFDVWAKSLAMQLNKMDLGRSLRLQLHIQQLLTEDRIEHECSQ